MQFEFLHLNSLHTVPVNMVSFSTWLDSQSALFNNQLQLKKFNIWDQLMLGLGKTRRYKSLKWFLFFYWKILFCWFTVSFELNWIGNFNWFKGSEYYLSNNMLILNHNFVCLFSTEFTTLLIRLSLQNGINEFHVSLSIQ